MENLFFFRPGIRAGGHCSGVSGRSRIEKRGGEGAVRTGFMRERPPDEFPAAGSGCQNQCKAQLMVRTEITLGVGGFGVVGAVAVHCISSEYSLSVPWSSWAVTTK